MSKTVRLLVSLAAFIFIVASGGCSHKPAYSELDTNRNSRNQNRNVEAQTALQPTGGTDAPQASASQPGPAQTEPKPTTASFMNAGGAIKDLPSYPRSVRVNLQFGPIQQAMVMTLLLHTRDSMEQVQAFYTQAIKENHWIVTDKLLDPELSEWTLNKDERNNAKVQVKKDPRTGSLEISIIRAEKIEAPK